MSLKSEEVIKIKNRNKYLGRIINFYVLNKHNPKLERRYKQLYDDARQELIEINIPLFESSARRLARKSNFLSKEDFEDNLEEMRSLCNLAGCITAKDYDATSEFATYYHKILETEFVKYLTFKTRKFGKIPGGIASKIPEIREAEDILKSESQRNPTPEEVLDYLQKKGIKSNKRPRVKLEHLKWLRLIQQKKVKIHPDDENFPFQLTSKEKNPLEKLVQKSIEIMDLVNNGVLNPREKEIIKKRYGLEGTPQLNFREIGVEYNLSPPRIMQIHKRAIEKLTRKICQTYPDYKQSFPD